MSAPQRATAPFTTLPTSTHQTLRALFLGVQNVTSGVKKALTTPDTDRLPYDDPVLTPHPHPTSLRTDAVSTIGGILNGITSADLGAQYDQIVLGRTIEKEHLLATAGSDSAAAASVGLSVLSFHQQATEAWHNSTLDLFSNNTTQTFNASTFENQQTVENIVEIIIIAFVVAVLSILTAGGNLMVLISFRMDKQLQTVSNYFLLSLAVADFFIGIVSMPLYTVYLLMGGWPLGPIICDTWLSIDYTMSNASVANLLLISFDRYLSVTRPLTYRAKRTPKRAAIMISLAWVISAVMWTPWIFAWPYIEGKRSVPENECYIQFLQTNQYITVITAIAAFYLPVLLMCILYFKIYLETEKRQKGLAKLQATKQISKYGDSSDDDVCTSLSHKRSDSSPDLEEVEELTHNISEKNRSRRGCIQKIRSCCRIDPETLEYADDSSSSDPPGSPAYQCTPSASQHVISIRRDQSLNDKLHNGRHDSRKNSGSGLMIPLIAVDSNRSTPTATPSTDMATTISRHSQLSSATAMTLQSRESESTVDGSQPHTSHGNAPLSSNLYQTHWPAPAHERQLKDRSDMYTILIKLPDANSGENAKPTIKMITDSETDDDDSRLDVKDAERIPMTERHRRRSSRENSQHDGSVVMPTTPTSSMGRRLSNTADLRMAMQARVAAKLVNKAKSQRARKKRQERKEENKAAKTLSAILLAFVVTWTPYNIFTVIKTFCQDECINDTLYAIGKFTSLFLL